ncbi:MAG: RNA-binding transcriptional accessory protein [Acholeplasmatales bacterium]|nr:RNA-binding transcriptional accessory protein [Acholeplasmatales bacterium]
MEEKELEIKVEEFFNDDLKKEVAANLGIKVEQVNTVLGMLKEGNTVPFIARYRKEQTGALDENQIREIQTQYEYGEALLKRKEAVIRLIDEKGMLTDELKQKIEHSKKLVEVEDLYRPFKEKKKTKATEAIALGLEPLAKELLAFPTKGSLENIVNKYVNEEKNITFDSAIQGAKYIIAEMISDNANYRKSIRTECYRTGMIVTKKKKKADDPTFQMYYDYSLEVKKLKSHNILAINRGEDKDVLNVSIEIDTDRTINYLNSKVIKNEESFATPIVKDAIVDSFNRLIFPSIEREVRSELTESAEDKAIEVFSVNLRNLLLQAPMKGKMVLGVDPAFRTGCKIAVVDKVGKVLAKTVIYQNQKFEGEKVPMDRIIDAKKKVTDFIIKYDIEIIAIGNGTASRETEEFIQDVLKSLNGRRVFYSIVNEAGASVYSASALAQEEFPTYSVEERSAVSIARRLQDPLSELVKIDPKSIGVGQYQHDVTQSKLSDSLDFVVSTAVNQVGVNINTASKSLLGYVSGINKAIAENIVKYREENGEFKNREQIKLVPKLGPKAFEQAVGFLRLPESTEVLDSTSIHPESYKLAKSLIKDLGIDKLGSEETKKIVEKADVDALISKYGKENEYTIKDILDAFIAPQRDPRDELDKPLLRCEALRIEDLKIGQELQGVVRNVVDFGVFVDCGVHEDGLVHISKISKNYIKHPSEVLSVGDVVKVWVLDVDLVRHKVSLTMLHE